MARVPEPKLEQSFTLNLLGDWGRANLHRACGWLSYEIGKRTGPHTRIGIWNARGMTDSVRMIGRGEADIALSTPAGFVKMALNGTGCFEGERYPFLRAIGSLPQNDRMVLAIGAEHQVRTFADLRRKKPALKLAIGLDDGISFMGFAARKIMDAAGISREEFESWGGEYVEREEPKDCIDLVASGKADGLIQEAIMTAWWQDLTKTRDMNFIPLEPQMLRSLKKDYGIEKATLPRGYFKGLSSDLPTIDYSDFLVFARTDLPDDLAYLIAWSMCEARETFEVQYRHIPPERSPVTYPLIPKKIARTPIKLHKGAERYYRDAKLL